MTAGRVVLQPTLRQLLSAEALSEANVVYGDEFLDRPVAQVVSGMTSARPGTLVVSRAENLVVNDPEQLKDLAGLLVIKPAPQAALASVGSSGAVRQSVGIDVDVERLQQYCVVVKTPLIVLSGIGDASQIVDEVRGAFLYAIKKASSRLHQYFVSLVLEGGVSSLVEELSSILNRPVAVESADFKVLAAENLGPMPLNQQKVLTEEVADEINRQWRAQEDEPTVFPEQPVRIGRRLVMPILFEGVVVGYLSVMIRPSDDVAAFSEYLGPAALAVLIDFSNRRREVSTFTVTHRGLLKELISGRTLSAGDQERLEQQYGFDLCDGFFVFALNLSPEAAAKEALMPLEESVPWTDFEAQRVFVLPYMAKTGSTWQQEADKLVANLKGRKPELVVQVGAGRLAATLLDVSDSFREARQALIIGSTIHGSKEFVLGYGDLGIKRLLYLLIDHYELDRFYEESLAPLEAYDAEWESELVSTLRVYLQQGANLNSAAKALFIHRHTMRYRLEQIADILKVDIDSPEVLLNLQIAYLIRDMKGKSAT
jgi:purine catabolism regulator